MRKLKAIDIDFACDILHNGGLVAFPTETVYGLGGNAYNDEVVLSIFQCKQRTQFNPISVCYSSFEEASADVELNESAQKLASAFLPGPLTIVLKRKRESRVSWLCSAGKDTLGIRIPENDIALQLLNKLDFPLAAPSANISSELSTTTANSVYESFKDSCFDLAVLDAGACSFGIESTIIDLSENEAKILRRGVISEDEVLEKCDIKLKFQDNSKSSHYKPRKPLLINVEKVEIEDALLAFGLPIEGAKYCLNLSKNSNLSEAAQNLFSMLRKLDSTDAKRICVMPIPKIGIGQAINDRLQKADKS